MPIRSTIMPIQAILAGSLFMGGLAGGLAAAEGERTRGTAVRVTRRRTTPSRR